jgi:hypothetical protein
MDLPPNIPTKGTKRDKGQKGTGQNGASKSRHVWDSLPIDRTTVSYRVKVLGPERQRRDFKRAWGGVRPWPDEAPGIYEKSIKL